MSKTNGTYDKILVAVDFDHSPEEVVKRAINVAKQGETKIKIIHCILPITDGYINLYGLSEYNFDSVYAEAIASSDKKLETLAGRYSSQYDIEYKSIIGKPVDMIVKISKTYEADLITLGSHGKHGFKLLMGSTANGVLHHAPCDTLMIRL